ncbi:hypothetical protein RHM66_01855 [Pseudomonas sp. RTB3]|nr:hypothetical protein RHM66_01855 [Pseudomonas sp. RTB3]
MTGDTYYPLFVVSKLTLRKKQKKFLRGICAGWSYGGSYNKRPLPYSLPNIGSSLKGPARMLQTVYVDEILYIQLGTFVPCAFTAGGIFHASRGDFKSGSSS